MVNQMTLEQIADVEHFDPATVLDELSPRAREIMDLLSEKVFVISNYNPLEKYDELIDILLKNMAEGFEFSEFRDFPVMYRFYPYESEKGKKEDVKSLPFRHFIINVIMWRPMLCIDPDNLTDDLIINSPRFAKIGQSFIKDYFDMNYIMKYNGHIPLYPNLRFVEINSYLNAVMCDTTYQLSKVSNIFNAFVGISSNLETFIDLEKRVPEFKECMDFTLDETMQPAEMEKALGEIQDKMIDAVINDDYPNMMKPLVQPNSGLNIKQVRDMVCNIGLKPDEDGRTIPHPINTNYLNKGGLYTTEYYYLIAISGRKAAVINNEYMGRTGHLLILIAIATASAKLSRTTMDCNTVNPIPIEIKTATHLKKLHGRRYRFPGEKKYHILDYTKDEHLIGQTVDFRSPVTCACRDGICRECYGNLYYTNIDNNDAGIYSATKVMNPVVQGILSAKHHQTTNSSMIEFAPEFNKFFSISSTDIILADNVDDIVSYSLLIRRENIMTTDGDESELDYTTKRRRRKKSTSNYSRSNGDDIPLDDESSDDDDNLELKLNYYTTKFEVVRNLHSKNEEAREYIEFSDKDEKELFMHIDLISRMTPGHDSKGDYLAIDLEAINPEEFVFLVDVENNELTKPMKSIQRVLNNKDHEGCDTYEDLVNKMLELLIASKLNATSVHAEMIIRQLVASSKNILKRPNFENIIMMQDYQLLTITTALKKNPSITTSMSTPYLKAQLVELQETFEKDRPGVFDPLFRKTLTHDFSVND